MGARLRVALVNDFEVILRGLESMLEQFPGRLTVTELDVGTNPKHRVDVALFDTYGHSRIGVDRLRSLAADARVGAVAVYTWRLPFGEGLDTMLASGARGVLAKSLSGEALVDALLAIHKGQIVVSPAFGRARKDAWPGRSLGLTERESEVAAFLAAGLSNREIADSLFISEHTVKSHLKAIFRKADVASRARAIARITRDTEFQRITGSG